MAIAKKKKRFFEVEMPILNKTTYLYGIEIKELEERRIKYDLTRVLRGKNTLIDLKVKVNEEKATAIPIKIKLLPTYLKRMVRKGTDYVEDSFNTKCKDAEIIVKPLLVTRRRVSRAVRKALKNKVKEELENYFSSKSSEQIFEDILKNNLQKSLSLKLKKIYPLSLCEIKILEVKKFLKEEVSKTKEDIQEEKDNSKK